MGVKVYKCKKCGNTELIVKKRECADCHFNGFVSLDPDADFEWLYDEELRQKLEKEYNTKIERSQNYDNGSCQLSDWISDACWTFECGKCDGEIVELIPQMEC